MGLQLPEWMNIAYTALTDDDLAGIVKICKMHPLGIKPEAVIQQIAANRMSVWRLKDEDTNVRLLLEIVVNPEGNELRIFGVFGRGLFKRINDAMEFCKLFANKYFCQAITGDVYSKGLAKLYESLGAKPIFTRYMLEG